MTEETRVVRGRVLSFTDDPAISGSRAYSLTEDGAVLVTGGLIAAVGAAHDILRRVPQDAVIDDHAGLLIMPVSLTPTSIIRRPR